MLNIDPDNALRIVAERHTEWIAEGKRSRSTVTVGSSIRGSVRRSAGNALLRLGARLTESP